MNPYLSDGWTPEDAWGEEWLDDVPEGCVPIDPYPLTSEPCGEIMFTELYLDATAWNMADILEECMETGIPLPVLFSAAESRMIYESAINPHLS